MSLMSCCLGIYSCTCVNCLYLFYSSGVRSFVYILSRLCECGEDAISRASYTQAHTNHNNMNVMGVKVKALAKIRSSEKEKNVYTFPCGILLHSAKFNYYRCRFCYNFHSAIFSPQLIIYKIVPSANERGIEKSGRKKEFSSEMMMLMMMTMLQMAVHVFNRRLSSNKFTHFVQT